MCERGEGEDDFFMLKREDRDWPGEGNAIGEGIWGAVIDVWATVPANRPPTLKSSRTRCVLHRPGPRVQRKRD